MSNGLPCAGQLAGGLRPFRAMAEITEMAGGTRFGLGRTSRLLAFTLRCFCLSDPANLTFAFAIHKWAGQTAPWEEWTSVKSNAGISKCFANRTCASSARNWVVDWKASHIAARSRPRPYRLWGGT